MFDDLPNEIWKDINGYEGLYKVSSMGRVKKVKAIYGLLDKLIKMHKNEDGYLVVGLYKNSKNCKKHRVHRLVAEAFIPNSNNYPLVNHKDENPSNPRLDNLEWCTYEYNATYGKAIQKRVMNTDYKAIVHKIDYKARTLKTQDKNKKLYQYDRDYNLIKKWDSIKEALEDGYKRTGIYACCNENQKTYRGYIWRYDSIEKRELNN